MRAIVLKLKDCWEQGKTIDQVYAEIGQILLDQGIQFKGIFIEVNSKIGFVWNEWIEDPLKEGSE